MKLLAVVPVAVAAAVALLTGATIWIGALVREPTVVAHPYEEGLTLDQGHRAAVPAGHGPAHGPAVPPGATCDLGAGPCALALDGMELRVELGPRPLAAMRELSVEAELRQGGAPLDGAEVALSFAMAGMDMGENRVRLAPAGGGRYRGKAILVRCLSGRRDWLASVAVRQGGRERRGTLALGLGE
jgi:hypothetical protein